MTLLKNDEMQVTYIPAISVTQITVRHTMGRVPVAMEDKPECVCGVARRIGYTGTNGNDLAIYRLKVKENVNDNATTLSTLFVVDGGLFVDYYLWQKKRDASVD